MYIIQATTRGVRGPLKAKALKRRGNFVATFKTPSKRKGQKFDEHRIHAKKQKQISDTVWCDGFENNRSWNYHITILAESKDQARSIANTLKNYRQVLLNQFN